MWAKLGIFVSNVLCDLDTKTEPLLRSMWPHPQHRGSVRPGELRVTLKTHNYKSTSLCVGGNWSFGFM